MDSRIQKLTEIRKIFFDSRGQGTKDYWADRELLQSYHETFGARIGWKWDAVLDELGRRYQEVFANVEEILDWGCGSGIATERFLDKTQGQAKSVYFLDRSRLARSYAAAQTKARWPHLSVDAGAAAPQHDSKGNAPGQRLVLISHVMTEITETQLEELLTLLDTASFVIWVEPGTPFAAKRLGAVRERFLEQWLPMAPCTHNRKCPMVTDSFASDWCHFFASPPKEVFQNSSWQKFSRTLNIDLRSLPVSFLVMKKRNSALEPMAVGKARMIGRPRKYKAFLDFQECASNGVEDVRFNKRTNSAEFRRLSKGGFLELREK